MPRSGAIYRWSLGLAIAVSAGLNALWPTGDAPAPSAPSTRTLPQSPALPEAVAVAPNVLAAPTVDLPPDIARNPFGGKDWADGAPRPRQSGLNSAPEADTVAAPRSQATGPGPTAPGTAAAPALATQAEQAVRQPVAPTPAHVDGDNAPGIGHEAAPAPQPE